MTVKAYQTAGGAWRVAALTQRGSDERPIVAIYNASTGAQLQNAIGDLPVDVLHDEATRGVERVVHVRPRLLTIGQEGPTRPGGVYAIGQCFL